MAMTAAGIRGNTVLATGQWYHVAATWDGTTVKIYVNGVLDNSPGTAKRHDRHRHPAAVHRRPTRRRLFRRHDPRRAALQPPADDDRNLKSGRLGRLLEILRRHRHDRRR